MADPTIFVRSGDHTNLVIQKWATDMFKHGLANNPLKNFMGTSDDSVIQIKKDFLKEKGDKITFALRGLLASDGQGDDGTYEGNEEAMVFLDDSVQIHSRGHSVVLNGKMTEQRTQIALRTQAKNALGEWMARAQASDTVAALSGLATNFKFAGQITGAVAAPLTVNAQIPATKLVTNMRHFCGGQTIAGVLERVANDAAVDSGDGNLFGTLVISYLKRMAKQCVTSTGLIVNPIRPVMVDGAAHYVCFADPDQIKALRKETAWLSAQTNANLRGKDNPIFSGMEGIWDGVIVKELPLLHRRSGVNGVATSEWFDTGDVCASGITVARGLFCGAQAGIMAYGQLPTWNEKSFEYGTKWGIQTDVIYGVKKTAFASGADFGCITFDTAINP